jgi:hypothetical protein
VELDGFALRELALKSACPAHVEVEEVARWIEDHATSDSCDYCGRTAPSPIAAPVDELAELVFESITAEWGHADDEGVPWEGGYQLVSPLSTYELLSTEGDEQLCSEDGLLTDLADGIGGDAWVPRDFLLSRFHDRLISAWEALGKTVKHDRRYFFLHADREDDPDYVGPSELLRAIGNAVEETGLLGNLEPDRDLFRGRTHWWWDPPSTPRVLGAPPVERALSSNRMSPAGISMFYGALDRETAVAEARAAETRRGRSLTVATFTPTRRLRVLDLARIPEVPSLYDPGRRHLRSSVIFLRSFAAELRKTVQRDRSEHVEYVPTQLVCDWFRSVYEPQDGIPLDGILYASAQREGGISCVLFVGPMPTGPGDDGGAEEEDRGAVAGGFNIMLPPAQPPPLELAGHERIKRRLWPKRRQR